MNISKIFKIALAVAIIGATILWAVGSVLPRSYAGTNLNVDIGSGPLSVTNASDQPVSVRFMGTGSRSFTVSSTVVGISGASTRQGSGSASIHTFEFELPSGLSEFTITGGANVNFVADTQTRLEATVQPMGANESRTTLIVAAVIVLSAIFYISRATDHRWINTLRHQNTSTQDTQPIAAAASEQVHVPRPYGDNRADISS